MKQEYIFWETDSSFDYCGGTYYQTDKSGFSIDIADNCPDITTLKGFGAFKDVEKCKDLVHLYCYIEENKKYLTENLNEKQAKETLQKLIELEGLTVKNINREINEILTA